MACWLLGTPRGWPGGICAWLSSGESTWLSSTPLASPLEGSGAFRQACRWSVMQCAKCSDGAAYLDEVLALGLGDEGLQLRCREGVDEASLRDDEQQHLGAGEDGQFVGLVQTVSWRSMRRAKRVRAPPTGGSASSRVSYAPSS